MLTVWRKLFLELDHMATTVLTQGPLQQRSHRPMGLVTGGAGTIAIGTNFDVFLADQFQGGSCELFQITGGAASLGAFGVVNNTAGMASSLLLSAPAPLSAEEVRDLLDDDGVNVPGVGLLPLIDAASPPTLGLGSPNYFPAACVQTDATTLAAYFDPAVPFDLNMGAMVFSAGETNDMRAAMAAGKDVVSTDDFWVVTMQGAYQGSTDDCTDPDDGIGNFPTIGISLSLGPATQPAEGGVLIYFESLRDTADEAGVDLTTMISQTTIHECGHEFGMDHLDLGIMKSSGAVTPEIIEPASELYMGVSLRRVIDINHPGFGAQ